MNSPPRVRLDLNRPTFQDELFGLEPNALRPILKTLRKLRSLDWDGVYRDKGLKWEQVKGKPGWFTIRLSLQSRAVVRREDEHMRFETLHTDHDSAYGRR